MMKITSTNKELNGAVVMVLNLSSFQFANFAFDKTTQILKNGRRQLES